MNIDMSKHTSILGGTQSGKTELSNWLFQKTGGLFIDIEDLGHIKAQITITRKSRASDFERAIKGYRRVKYVPSPHIKKSSMEIKWIWEKLRKMNKNIYLYVDEIQNWGDARINICDVFAVRGLKHGVHLVSITQRPANLSKTIASQTMTFIFFECGDFERKYFNTHKLPYDKIMDKLVKQEKYCWVIYNRGIGVSEPYKLSI